MWMSTSKKQQERETHFSLKFWFPLFLLITCAVLILLLWKEKSFPSHPWYQSLPEFSGQVIVSAAAVIASAAALVKIGTFFYQFLTGKQRKKLGNLVLLLPKIFRGIISRNPLFLFVVSVLSIISLSLLVMLALLPPSEQIHYLLKSSQTSSSKPKGLAISPDGKELYVADEEAAQLIVFMTSPLRIKHRIPLDIKPSRIALTPDGKKIFVTSVASGEVHVIDNTGVYKVITKIPNFVKPYWIVITPDGKKAFISNEGPVPKGSISIIDTATYQLLGTIEEVNCPEGLDIARDTKLLYVASQCGEGSDPVFVIDTETNTPLPNQKISGLAVGTTTAVKPDGTKVYVARGDYRWPGPFKWWDFSRKDRTPLGVVDTTVIGHPKIKTNIILDTSVSSLAMTTDGKYILASSGTNIAIIDTETDRVVNKVKLPALADGIAISPSNWVYVTIPEKGVLLAFALKGLV
jgi:YVTN family beta-propeller protein